MIKLEQQQEVPEGYIRLSGPLERDNIVNGEGLRAVLWTQGCRQHCPGCQNPDTWACDSGVLIKTEDIISQLSTFKDQVGITFCGGEPMIQARELLKVARWAHSNNWNVWSFTGLIYENIYKPENKEIYDLINELDCLIDGPFILSKRDIVHYKWRGSSNQRVLHLKNGKIINQE